MKKELKADSIRVPSVEIAEVTTPIDTPGIYKPQPLNVYGSGGGGGGGGGKTYTSDTPDLLQIDNIANKINITDKLATKDDLKTVDDKAIANETSITNIQTNYANKNKANVYKEAGTFEKDLNAKIGTFATLLTPQVVNAFSPKLLVVSKEAFFNVIDPLELKVNDIDGEQIVDKGNIDLNTKSIQALALKQESALKYRGIYDSTETYDKNDIVAIIAGGGKIDTYLSLINNNTQPLSDKAAWFETPDLTVSVDLSQYYTKIETNDLLRPLGPRLDAVEIKLIAIQKAIDDNKIAITNSNTAIAAVKLLAENNRSAIGTNTGNINKNTIAIEKNTVAVGANTVSVNTLNTEAVKLDTTQTIIGKKIFENGLSIGSTNYNIDVNGNTFEFKRSSSLTNVAGKDAIDPEHFITKKQYDEAVTNATTAIGNNTTAITTKKANIAFIENSSVWTGDTQGGKKIKKYNGKGSITSFDADFQLPNLTDVQQVMSGGMNRKRISDSKWFPLPFYGNSSLFLTDGTNGKLYYGTTTTGDFVNSKFYEISVEYISSEVATRAEIREFKKKKAGK